MIELRDLFINGTVDVTDRNPKEWDAVNQQSAAWTCDTAIKAFQEGFECSDLVASAIYRDGICLAWTKGFFLDDAQGKYNEEKC